MKERLLALRPWILRIVAYPAFFFFWFLLFLYVTFPYDRLKDLLIATMEAPRPTIDGMATPSNLQVSIGSLGPTFLPGLEARDVTITFLPTRSTERPGTMTLQKARVRVSLLSLLSSKVSAHLELEGMGGTVQADVEAATSGPRPGLRVLTMQLERVQLAQLPPVAAAVGLPVSGALSGTIELNVPDGNIPQATGSMQVSIDDLRVGDGRAQFMIPRFGGVTIEQIRAGRLEGQVRIRDGLATIERFSTRSREFAFNMTGRMALRPELQRSELNALMAFQLTDEYRRKSEAAGRIMTVLEMVPDLRAARRQDGMMSFRCRGALEQLSQPGNCMPDGSGGAPGGAFPPRRGFE